MRPSTRAACAVTGWLAVFAWMVLCCLELPLLIRIVICVCATVAGLLTIRGVFLLRGRWAVRSLRWSDNGQMSARLGHRETEDPVSIGAGSFRLGGWCLLLWLETGAGIRAVFIDGGLQEERGFRRLCRSLDQRRRGLPDRRGRPS